MKQINGDTYIETGKLNMTEEEIRTSLQKEGIISIKGILDKQYIEYLSYTDNMIMSEQNKYKQNGNYKKNIIYDLDIEDLVQTFIGEKLTIVLVDSKLNNKDFNMIIKLDSLNNTYSIFLEDYIKKYNYTKDMNKRDININTDSIEINDYNSHIKVNTSESYIISQYFSEYRMKMLNDTKDAYELLDTSYRKEKYGSYEEFKNYVDNNKDDIQYASINKYQVSEYNGVKEYICVDQNGKYYIFMEKDITDYNVVLDTYTIDLPDFTEKYNNNSNEIKCGMNIQKVFDAINDKDYNYVYNKLDDNFRSTNFSNKKSFKEYAEKYFANNQLVYESCKKSGDLYIYDVTVTEGTESNKNAVRKNFVMQLLEGTDFVMSFNIK